ncbi:MAG: C40 family peptidase [Armatimonadetes bacterium]|nr:C40 family peptidase [Armatimonadota bacterium]
MVQLAVISKNVLNLHTQPDVSSELETQAILGQPAWIEKEQDEWVYIRTWDGCGGWALSTWVLPRTDGTEYAASGCVARMNSLFADILAAPDESADILTKAVITSELEILESDDEWTTVVLPGGEQGYIHSAEIKQATPPASPPSGDELVATAKRFIGIPYLWGGATPFGLDCSGFVQLVYHIHGLRIPRNSYQQAEDERAVPVEREALVAGDLVFFAGGEGRGRITHVGMSIGGLRFIHALGGGTGVTISSLEEHRFKDIYWGARRLLPVVRS